MIINYSQLSPSAELNPGLTHYYTTRTTDSDFFFKDEYIPHVFNEIATLLKISSFKEFRFHLVIVTTHTTPTIKIDI